MVGSLTGKQESDIPEQATEDGRILPRTRLIEGLLAAKAVRVVLLEAPAGYSKTTTLRLWEREDSRDFAWVSCQTRHNDPSVLIEEIVFALSRFGQIDDEVLMALGSPTPDLNLVLGRLARAIEAMDPFVLAIDDARESGEVAISIRPDYKLRGISWSLLEHVVAYAEARGLKWIESIEDRENRAAISLEREMGFIIEPIEDDPTHVLVRRQLR